jgi:phosphopantothenoylcysteine synthetase/decarboxylase
VTEVVPVVTRPARYGVLYVVACAAPPVVHVRDLISAAQRRGWDTCLIVTPAAERWVSDQLPALAAQTGHPVRSVYKLLGEPDVLPPADAMLVAPATSNTINKWAAGISDTLALGLITEAIGRRIPLIAMPCLNRDQVVHPAFGPNVDRLRRVGVVVLLDDEGQALRGAGKDHHAVFPWDAGLDELDPVPADR